MDFTWSDTVATVEWRNVPQTIPGPGVDIWKVSISSPIELNNFFLNMLNEEETEKSLRYRIQGDKLRYIYGRGALRFLLGKYLKKYPRTIQFVPGPNKKPLMKKDSGHHLHFNVSHSGDFVLIAISDSAVGVDIEKIDPDFSFREILTANFTREEFDLVEHAANPQEAFYWLWTRKESLLKATAKGMIDNLRSVSVLGDRIGTGVSQAGLPDAWDIHSFKVASQYFGSVTCRKYTMSINFLEGTPSFFLEAV